VLTQQCASPAEVRNAALDKVRGLIIHLAKRYCRGRRSSWRMDLDDLIQEASLFFLVKYDATRAEPGAFVRICIMHVMTRERRQASAERVKRERYAQELVPHGPPPGPEPEDLAELNSALAALSPAMRQLLSERFGLAVEHARGLKELAGGLVSKQAISSRVKVCIRHMRIAFRLDPNHPTRATSHGTKKAEVSATREEPTGGAHQAPHPLADARGAGGDVSAGDTRGG
jgi:DNA-directed RNA polymerase specialized sigma24 family protein